MPELPTIIVEDAPDRPSKRRRLDLDTYSGHTPLASSSEWHEEQDAGHCSDDVKTQLTCEGHHRWESSVTSLSPVSKLCTDLESLSDSTPLSESAGEIANCCFGMIMDLPVTTCRRSTAAETSISKPVFLGATGHVYCCVGRELIGTLDCHATEALAKLAADAELELQLACSFLAEASQEQQRETSCLLRAIIYGPKNRAEDVGDFVDKCGYYLQDPLACDRNVPYYNPHTLSSLDGYLPMTLDLEAERQPKSHVEDYIQTANGILADFKSTEIFTQTPTPAALRTELSTHQKQALTFFKRREKGLHSTHNDLGIWRRSHDATRSHFFINTITDRQQSEPPPVWKGGILADEMGLGKTLSMIALVASDKDARASTARPVIYRKHEQVINSTLIVVRPNVLSVWETQIDTHIHRGRMTWFRHHGRYRFNSETAAKQPDIVFTTYQTIEYEQRRPSAAGGSIFSFRWNRIILDEAHVIRNSKTSTAKAIASLHAESRWAVSGTPIQNVLTDFVGLFKFLHFHPYDDPRSFDDDISELWRSGQADEAAQKFKRLLDCIMIRRLKTTIELPPRHDEIVRIQFDPSERENYRKVQRPVAEWLDNDMNTCDGIGRLWLNALEQINKLRLLCDLGVSIPFPKPTQPLPYDSSDTASGTLATRFSMGGTSCDQCLQIIELPESGIESERNLHTDLYYSRCCRLFCSGCASLLRFETPKPCECDNQAVPCSIKRVPIIQLTPRVTPSKGSSSAKPAKWESSPISSKVRTLLSEIKAHPHEKSVVFSFWTSSLDMVERALELDGIHYVRIDGKVSTSNRKRALEQFNQNPKIRVVLLTISCGAVGIDLTTASRAHLLEPQWNPSIEEQALARIHRIGQTRPVTTTRYVMENSFEEYILNVQDRKKLLATVLLSNDDSSQELRSLVHGK